jgi:hypothetical protein
MPSKKRNIFADLIDSKFKEIIPSCPICRTQNASSRNAIFGAKF